MNKCKHPNEHRRDLASRSSTKDVSWRGWCGWCGALLCEVEGASAWLTPLGRVEIQTAAATKLAHDKSEHHGGRCQKCFDVDDALEKALNGTG